MKITNTKTKTHGRNSFWSWRLNTNDNDTIGNISDEQTRIWIRKQGEGVEISLYETDSDGIESLCDAELAPDTLGGWKDAIDTLIADFGRTESDAHEDALWSALARLYKAREEALKPAPEPAKPAPRWKLTHAEKTDGETTRILLDERAGKLTAEIVVYGGHIRVGSQVRVGIRSRTGSIHHAAAEAARLLAVALDTVGDLEADDEEALSVGVNTDGIARGALLFLEPGAFFVLAAYFGEEVEPFLLGTVTV